MARPKVEGRNDPSQNVRAHGFKTEEKKEEMVR